MKRWITAVAVGLGLAGSSAAMAQAAVNQPAPAFSVQDATGKTVKLADFKGKYVVLEWVNPGCPFVQKHYNSANMPATQKDALAKGAVWLAVSSTAKEAGDYRPPADLAGWLTSKSAATTATLMDDDGKIGRSYGARTTPHMYVIDPQGKLVYAGAIDSKPTANPADIKSATNYVRQALDEVFAGKPVSQPTTQAYGCSIKYASAG
ncbi:thioredoxin family protein [Aquincola sp. S2]|uniref:Thioredoxin family protein n=1 Tax=Pseudaquabacterium terrae TaxID=2732868 RepID=A0ABX2EBA2_9BURK|nr:thioredoxin family protein [Aquabacterium terrae]NRF65622.1 thioredoxin family protein [Aquabacterium terrae]